MFPNKSLKQRNLNGQDANYGMAKPLPIKNPKEIKIKTNSFLARLGSDNFKQIEIDTRDQIIVKCGIRNERFI